MRNHLSLKVQETNARCLVLTGTALIFLFVSLIAGCGGSKSANNTVPAVNVAPAILSMGAGQVITLSPSAVNSDNTVVTTTFTFNSTNTSIATISPQGSVCAGVWDSAFVVCNGLDAQNNPISGTAIITATAAGITSGPVSVSVHPSIPSVSVDPATDPCFSITKTHHI